VLGVVEVVLIFCIRLNRDVELVVRRKILEALAVPVLWLGLCRWADSAGAFEAGLFVQSVAFGNLYATFLLALLLFKSSATTVVNILDTLHVFGVGFTHILPIIEVALLCGPKNLVRLLRCRLQRHLRLGVPSVDLLQLRLHLVHVLLFPNLGQHLAHVV
jgi:hypothetical protein